MKLIFHKQVDVEYEQVDVKNEQVTLNNVLNLFVIINGSHKEEKIKPYQPNYITKTGY